MKTSQLTVWKTTLTSKPLQLSIDALYGQAHDVVVATIKTSTTDIANPLLYAVGASLVEGMVVADVVGYFIVTELLERHFRGDAEKALLLTRGQANAGGDVVDSAAKLSQHAVGISFIKRLTHDLVVADDNGVGGDEELVVSHCRTIGVCLLMGYVGGNVSNREIVRIALVNTTKNPYGIVDAQTCQQFLTPRRVAG